MNDFRNSLAIILAVMRPIKPILCYPVQHQQ